MSRIKIGTSGFSYKDWLGNFYPQFCCHKDYLRFYASKFNTVEIDSTYYRIPTTETVKKWYKSTPDSFCFSAKFPNVVTHEGETAERLKQAAYYIDVMRHLEDKLGVLLLQFPYRFKPDSIDLLYRIIDLLPEDIRFAIELRNKSWLEEQSLFEVMKSKNVGFCLIDHPWMPKSKIRTADFTYIRFLGDRKSIENDFSYIRYDRDEELGYWQDIMLSFLEEDIDSYAYFNNHYSGHAPTTANRLLSRISA